MTIAAGVDVLVAGVPPPPELHPATSAVAVNRKAVQKRSDARFPIFFLEFILSASRVVVFSVLCVDCYSYGPDDFRLIAGVGWFGKTYSLTAHVERTVSVP